MTKENKTIWKYKLVSKRRLTRNRNPYTFHTMPFINWLIENEEFSNPEKVSVIYLASYQNYKGKLLAKNNVPLSKKLIQEKLKISNPARFNSFYKKLFEKGIVTEDENGLLHWNNEFSLKGKDKLNGIELIRIYDKQIQHLFNENAPKTLYPLIALSPYIAHFENRIALDLAEIAYLCEHANTRSCGRQLKLMTIKSGANVFVKQGNLIFVNPSVIKKAELINK